MPPSLYENLEFTQSMVLFGDNFLIYLPNIHGCQLMVDGDFVPLKSLLLTYS